MAGELTVRNRQRVRPLNLRLFRTIARHLLETQFKPARYELGVHLVDADQMAQVNEQFLQHSGSTDVITFDYAEASTPARPLESPLAVLHGDIFISLPDALRQAREFKTTWQSELTRYLVHGLLHLQGYDDLSPKPRKEMKRQEERLLKQVSRDFALNQLHKPKRAQHTPR